MKTRFNKLVSILVIFAMLSSIMPNPFSVFKNIGGDFSKWIITVMCKNGLEKYIFIKNHLNPWNDRWFLSLKK